MIVNVFFLFILIIMEDKNNEIIEDFYESNSTKFEKIKEKTHSTFNKLKLLLFQKFLNIIFSIIFNKIRKDFKNLIDILNKLSKLKKLNINTNSSKNKVLLK